ncbi:MAG: aspartate aminotransferase family protein [Limisphaerales bacterium]
MNELMDNQAVARFFPGGSNGEYGLPVELVPVLSRGRGCRVWDQAGREFLDMTMAWGAALVGHAHPAILEAAVAQAALGANFAAVNERSLELAERLVGILPCAEQVRFVTSGTEATLLCLRIAHAATGRRRILKFAGAYHGQHSAGIAGMLRGAGADGMEADLHGCADPGLEGRILVAPFNDLEGTRVVFQRYGHEIAAVLVEPLHRCLAPLPGFLAGVRELATKHGNVLIFDETVTGFRLGLSGAQGRYGVVPDLAAFGKALGGGYPLGAYAGSAELMRHVDEHGVDGAGYVWSASTAGGNPVSCAAALATLDVLSEDGVYDRLFAMGARLRELLARVMGDAGEVVQTLGEGPLAQVAFSSAPVTSHRGWMASDRQRGRALMLALVRVGVFLNPMGTKLYLSIAHGEEDLEELGDKLGRAVGRL